MAWFQVNFFSGCNGRAVPLNVLIPGDFTFPLPMSDKPYKTLYLLHGYMCNCSDWLLNSQIQEISQQFNIAVVMPSADNGYYVDQPRSGIRGSEYIGKELVNFTRTLFPLSDKREDTIIAGLSMGGYGTLYNALKYGDVFGNAIAMSSPFVHYRLAEYDTESGDGLGITRDFLERLHGDFTKIAESDRNLELLAKQTLDEGKTISNFYIACGYNDTLAHGNRTFTSYLKSINFPHVYEEGPGSHEWAFWNEFLRRGLRRIIPAVSEMLQNPFWVENDALV